MTTAEILREARALIEDPAKWCANGWGHSGRRCASHAITTVVEAVDPAAVPMVTETPAWRRLRTAMGMYVGDFNDSHTHAEVLDAFDRAIALAEGA